ncbi:glycine--tRNA ligase [Candidatus Woesearchaeota archaeon]|nr:glycine--tRNA ligase [Candidatus Woesearchaeota archaeon]
MSITIDEMASFCKRKGIVFPSSEIYGGLTGFFDYGPLGSEIKNNLKQAWWKYFVHDREDVVGIDGTIISHPKTWEASGHVANFDDFFTECVKCHERYRADHLIEDVLHMDVAGLKTAQLNKLIKEHHVKCQKCKSELAEVKPFNMMFTTFIGPVPSKEATAYLRPETAQNMFLDFKSVTETGRVKLPFGIAQMGKAFRNEIAPRNFLFRCREFEQMEIEYFIHPDKANECPFLDEVRRHKLLVYSAELQHHKKEALEMTMQECIDKKIISTAWHAYWLAKAHQWFVSLGADAKKFRIRQHVADEKSHYALDTWDLEYEFPFGWKELQGMANRTDYDLKQHMKHSGKDLSLFDEESKQKIIPHVVAEPSQGVDRAFLVFLYNAYQDDKQRGNVVLKLHPTLAPFKVAVFPLLSNKEELTSKAREVFTSLKTAFTTFYDRTGSVGRRYARMDEIGTPYCVTVDFDSLDKQDVTVRDRDSTKQMRVPINELKETLRRLLAGELAFSKAGTPFEPKKEVP